MKFQKLIDALEEAKTKNEDSELFCQLVNQSIEACQLEVKDIAERFGTSSPSIRRWINGRSQPHPVMRPQIYEAFIKMLKEDQD